MRRRFLAPILFVASVCSPSPIAGQMTGLGPEVRLAEIHAEYVEPLEGELAALHGEDEVPTRERVELRIKIAEAFLDHGAFLAAEAAAQQAVQESEAAFGGDSVELARALDLLGTTYALQRDYATARDAHQRSLEILSHRSDEGSPARAFVSMNLGSAQLALGRPDLAEPLLKGAFETLTEAYGPAAQQAMNSLEALGELYLQTGRIREADEVITYALTIRSEAFTFAPSEEEAASYIANVRRLAGALKSAIGLYTEAEPLLLQALEAVQAQVDESHPLPERVLVDVVALYERNGDEKKAAEFRARVEQLHSANIGFAYPEGTPILTPMPAVESVSSPSGPLADARIGDWVEYAIDGELYERREVVAITPAVVIVATSMHITARGWMPASESPMLRDTDLRTLHGLGDLELGEGRVQFRGQEIPCIIATIEDEGMEMTSYFAPEVVPLGGLVRMTVGDMTMELTDFARGPEGS